MPGITESLKASVVMVLAVGVLLAVLPSTALAEGTGVDFTRPNPQSKAYLAQEAQQQAEAEAAYQQWLADGATSTARGTVIPMYEGPHFRYLAAPAHKQAKNYYCGPATCQIIDDFWGSYVSQATYAAKYGCARRATERFTA